MRLLLIMLFLVFVGCNEHMGKIPEEKITAGCQFTGVQELLWSRDLTAATTEIPDRVLFTRVYDCGGTPRCFEFMAQYNADWFTHRQCE